MDRPREMPSIYSDNNILMWLADGGNYVSKMPLSDLNLMYDEICSIFDLRENILKSKTRKREVVIPKYIMMYVASKVTSESLVNIGKFFHTDHSMVIYAIHSVRGMIDVNDAVFMPYWDAYRHYSKYYKPELENTKRANKRFTASLPSIKNDILNIFELTDKEFYYKKGVGQHSTPENISRLIFNYIATKIGHRRCEIDRYLKQYDGFSNKALISINNQFDKRGHNLLNMWEQYIIKSDIYPKLKLKSYERKNIAA